MLVPDSHWDPYTYHLAAPEQFLKLHRFTAVGTSTPLQCPLTAELVYALAVALRMEALPHFIQVIPFVAAVALLAGRCVALGGRAAGWVTVGLVATFGLVGAQMVIAKNDLAAASYVIAGAVCLARGLVQGASFRWLAVSAVLFGCSAAVKYNGHALLVLAWVGLVLVRQLRGGGWKTNLVWLGMAALPVLPWLVKSWIFVGDPLWPFLSMCFPQALWDRECAQALEIMREGGEGWRALLKAGPEFVKALLAYQPALALSMVFCLMGWGKLPFEARWLMGYAAVGFAALYVSVPAEGVRLALPLFALWAAVSSLVVVQAVARWPRWGRYLALGVGVAAGWLSLGTFLSVWTARPGTVLGYLVGRLSQEQYLSRQLSTLWETGAELRRIAELRGFFMIGDRRFYRLPGRYFSERIYGRNLAWVLARECASPDEIRVKLRQMNCRHVVYNFITEGFPHHYAVAFKWDKRQLELWEEFVGRHLEVVVPSRHVDHVNGGFCVYRLREDPLVGAPGYLPYLPGIESLYYEVTRHGLTRDLPGYVEAARRLYARFPHVDYISDLVARGYRIQERWSEAYKFYLPGTEHGTINDANFFNMGILAANRGEWGKSYRLITRAAEIYPYLRDDAERILAKLRRVAAAPGRL